MDDNEALLARIDEAIAARAPQARAVLAELVGVASVNPLQPGVTPGAYDGGEQRANQLFARHLDDIGMRTVSVGPSPDRPNLVGTWGRGLGRSLALNCHIDTVSPAAPDARPHPDPWTLVEQGGYLYGLGASDTKSGHAVVWLALRALADAGVVPEGEVQVHSVVGEETMSHELGTSAVIEGGYRTDAALVIEPTSGGDLPLAVFNTAAGNYLFHMTVRGKAAHWASRGAAIHPGGGGDDVGVNAIDKALFVYQALRQLEEQWGISKRHPQFAPGTFIIHSGVLHADVGTEAAPYFPDRARFDCLLSFPPGETGEDIASEVEAHVRAACQTDPWLREHPVEFEWEETWPPAHTDPQDPFARAVLAARNDVADLAGLPHQDHSRAGSAQSDASFYEAASIPALVCGPGDLSSAHAAHDRVAEPLLQHAARMVARLILLWCTADGDVQVTGPGNGR